MKLFIDGNIILDVLQKREPHYQDSSMIWKLCETEQASGCVSALTIANLVYVMRKELSPAMIEDVIHKLGLIFQITELTATDLSKASKMHLNDFEDALQASSAERIPADYIITRNVKDFAGSKVKATTPTEFLAKW